MAQLIAPPALVTGPARTPAAYGLDSVLAWRPGDRFESGVQWTAQTCAPAQGRGGPYCDPADVVGLPKDLDSWGGFEVADATPFVILGEFACNPIGTSFEEAQAAAQAHLLSREIQRVEQAFWTGDLGQVPNLAGANGADAPVALTAQTTITLALATLEQAMGAEYGSAGVIHMNRFSATLLESKLVSRGGRLYTSALDTPVVVGTGYGDEQTLFGTPVLAGWRSDVIAPSARPGDLLDRATNDLYAVVERTYVIGHDPCPTFSVDYTVEG